MEGETMEGEVEVLNLGSRTSLPLRSETPVTNFSGFGNRKRAKLWCGLLAELGRQK
jgi:hypothetical protein